MCLIENNIQKFLIHDYIFYFIYYCIYIVVLYI